MKSLVKKITNRRVVQDAFWYTLANIVIQGSSLIAVLFVSRYLGPTNIGIYSFLQNYIAFFATCLTAFDIYINWEIVKHQDKIKKLYFYTKIKGIITSSVVALFILISLVTLPADLVGYTLVLVIPLITTVFSSFIFVLQHENRSKRIAIGMAVSALMILSLKIIAVVFQATLSVFVLINSLDGMLLTALAVYAILVSNGVEKTPIVFPDIKIFLYKSIYPFIYISTWYIVLKADQFFVPLTFDARTLGIYSSAVKVVEMSNVLVVIAQSLIIPRMFAVVNRDSKTFFYKSLYLYIALGTIAASCVSILAPLIVSVLFGQAYLETIPILRVYAWSIPGLFVTYFFTVIAMSEQKVKTLAYFSIALSVGTLISLFFVAKVGSIILFAYTSVCVYSLSAFALYMLWRYNRI